MERITSFFCHVPEGLPEADARRELQRQHDALAQYAADTGRTVEYCFFHVGTCDPARPDPVLLRFLQCAQAGELGLVLAECEKCFPLTRQVGVPRVELYLVREGVRRSPGCEEARVEEKELFTKNVYRYRGF